MKINSITKVLLMSLLATSCINNDYDLNKNISLLVGMDGSLNIPLGETVERKLGSILKADDIEGLLTDDDMYGIHKIQYVTANIPNFNADKIQSISANSNFSVTFNEIADASYTTRSGGPSTLSADLGSIKAPISIPQTNIPKEVKSLKFVEFSYPINLNITTNVNITDLAGDLYYTTLNIKFPIFFQFSDESNITIITDASGNKYKQLTVSNQKFRVNGNQRTWSYNNLAIKGLDFSDTKYNDIIKDNKLTINNESIEITGSATVDLGAAQITDLKSVSGNSNFNINDIAINVIKGELITDIIPEEDYPHTTITFNGLSDNVNNASNLDLPDINLLLEIGNPIGVPIDVDLKMYPYKNGKIIDNIMVSPRNKFTISANTENGINNNSKQISKFILASSEYIKTGYPLGYTPIEVPELKKLLESVPDSIVIDAIPTAKAVSSNSDDWHLINLSKKNLNMDINCNANIPFILGDNISVIYQDTIKNIQNETDNLFDKISFKQLQLNVTTFNGTPLDLKLKAIGMSTGCESEINADDLSFTFNDGSEYGTVAAGSYNTESNSTNTTETNLTINITENTKGALKRLDGIKLIIIGNIDSNKGTKGGIPLKPSQTIKAKATIKVTGVQTDLNTL